MRCSNRGRTRVDGRSATRSLRPLAVSDEKLGSGEVDILDAQAGTFEEAQSGPIEQGGHQARGSSKMREQRRDLGRRENHWQALGALRAHELVHPGELSVEHLGI